MLPVWPARRIAECLFPDVEPLRAFFIAVWCYILLVHFQMMILGTAGLLTLPWSLAFGVAIVAATMKLPPAKRPLNPGAALSAWFAAASPHARVAGVALAIPTLYCFVRLAATEGPHFMWDDWAYHGPVVTGMMRSDSTRFFRHNMAMYYPFNPHLLNMETTLAGGTLAWTWMATTLWVFVASLAWATLSLNVDERGREFFLLAGALFGMSQEVRWFEQAFCPVDIAVAIALLSAFAVARPRGGAGDGELRLNALLCGLIVGYAVGTKHFYMVPSVCAALTCLYWSTLGRAAAFADRRAAWTMASQVFGLGFLGVFLSGSYWYLYNIVLTGNPLFPLRFAFFPGTIKGSGFRRTTFMWWGEQADWSPDFWANALKQWINWPFYMGVGMSVGLLAGVVVCAVLAWRRWSRQPEATFPVGVMPGMMAAAWLLLLAYPHLPYSGTYNVTDDLIISRRFLVFCLVGALAFWAHAAGWTTRGGWQPLAVPTRVAFWFLTITHWPFVRFDSMILPDATWDLRAWFYYVWEQVALRNPLFPWDPPAWGAYFQGRMAPADPFFPLDVAGWIAAMVLVVGVAVARLWPRAATRALSLPTRMPWSLTAALAATITLVGVLRPLWFPGPYNTRIQSQDPTLMHGVWALEQLPADSRIGSLSDTAWEVWWLSGSRGQFEPVFLHHNGAAIDELHTMFANDMVDNDDPEKLPRLGLPWSLNTFPRPDLFAERIRASRVDYVFCTKYPDCFWYPDQRDALRELADFALIYDNGFNEIYQRIDQPGEQPARIPAPGNRL